MCKLPEGNPFAPMPEHLVGGAGTVSGDHLKRPDAAGEMRQVGEQIQKVRIDSVNIARAEVPQEVIDRRQRVRQVGAAAEVLDRKAFARVRVDEIQGAGGRWQCPQGTRQRQNRNCAREAGDKPPSREQAYHAHRGIVAVTIRLSTAEGTTSTLDRS